MAEVELIMPKMGESIMEATILKWLKQEGDKVEADEPVLEIATDKVDSEVPSPVEGIISKMLFQKDDVVEVGKAIAIITTEAEASGGNEPPQPKATGKEPQVEPSIVKAEDKPEGREESLSRSESNRFYSPLVLNIARKENVSIDELEGLNGSGKGGRVTKKDILSYINNDRSALEVKKKRTEESGQIKQTLQQNIKQPKYEHGENVEIIEMDRMRKLIADHMVRSKHTSPHVTSFVEADVTNLVNWRNKIKNKYQEREGEKITFTPIFIEAVIKAIKDYPMVNSSVEGHTIIRKKDINIGMAAALPNGNLIVPVIKNSDQLNLVGLSKKVNDLAGRARNNKLKPEEIEGGTFTLTNVGTFGNLMGTPVINQPQVAILATGVIKKKPVVVETPQGDVIAIRHVMYLSHSYDHRVVDGALGGAFVRRVGDYLEQFDTDREI